MLLRARDDIQFAGAVARHVYTPILVENQPDRPEAGAGTVCVVGVPHQVLFCVVGVGFGGWHAIGKGDAAETVAIWWFAVPKKRNITSRVSEVSR